VFAVWFLFLLFCRRITYYEVQNRMDHEDPRGGGGVEVEPHSVFTLGARWVGWSTPRPRALYPGKGAQYPLYRRFFCVCFLRCRL
jgi:hypothetical protein